MEAGSICRQGEGVVGLLSFGDRGGGCSAKQRVSRFQISGGWHLCTSCAVPRLSVVCICKQLLMGGDGGGGQLASVLPKIDNPQPLEEKTVLAFLLDLYCSCISFTNFLTRNMQINQHIKKHGLIIVNINFRIFHPSRDIQESTCMHQFLSG